jgi:O-acetyl-ADP-ribose deacetylase (regulator of RNase III)
MTPQSKITITLGDITQQAVDAIVNAANSSLLGGGGVDGAIHRAAGPELLVECRTLNGCPTGAAKISKGYRLPAKYVIHTVGPIWHGGTSGEDELLASCYRNSLALAAEYGLKSVAFPAISTGIYGFPLERAAAIAVREIHDALVRHPGIERVVLVCFGRKALDVYSRLLNRD